MSELVLRSRQRTRALKLTPLRSIVRHVLERELKVTRYELGFHFVGCEEMASVNQEFLQHEGSTDVITFDYGSPSLEGELHGEIFVCVNDAVKQAKEFHTTWQEEVTRYVIHGLLHLQGYDDIASTDRRKMKREEDRILRDVSNLFTIASLAQRPARNPTSKPRPR